MGSFRVCLCYTRKFNMMDLEPPSDVKDLFKKYAGNGGTYMTQAQLSRFLVEAQGVQPENATVEAQKIMEGMLKRRPHIAKNTNYSLTLDDFFYFIFSVDLNPPFQPHIHQDMKAPLSHYFIYTGHNSYLTGNQLTGDCSDRLIIKALQRGVRVIELDLWPTSSKDDIQVLHGRTLTTPVDLLTCLRAIRDYAFEKSEYPVIITLEDHLKPKLQAKAAEMIKETFEDMLFCPESDSLDEFPSPEELRHRILISTKTPKECLEAENASGNVFNTSHRRNSSDFDHSSHRKIDELESEPVDEVDENGYSCPDSSEPLVYKRLISIHQKKCKIEEAIKLELKAIRVSLSEQKLEKAVKPHGKDLVRFTQKNILRIYPKGTRFNSSNYKPFLAWMHGAQMVAFNMQGYGRFLWQMQGMFRANGGCGYVKKPDFLINGEQLFDPRSRLPFKTTLKVKLYLGDGWRVDFKKDHFDKFSPPDFYTRIGIAGVGADEVMHVTTVQEDRWTPIWNQEFEFPLTVPELALLRVEVYEHDSDKKDDFGGQTCLPVSELRPGIHAIPLYSDRGELHKSVKLLMRFGFT